MWQAIYIFPFCENKNDEVWQCVAENYIFCLQHNPIYWQFIDETKTDTACAFMKKDGP